MSVRRNDKIKNLFQIWPPHTVASSVWLKEQGYSRGLLKKYLESGWIEKYERGAFIRPNDIIKWSGAIWGAQKSSNIFVGGKTAIELQGQAHFISFNDPRVFLFSKKNVLVPSWLKGNASTLNLISVVTDVFPSLTGHIQHTFGDYSLWVSNIAQAFLEYMYLVPKYYSYEEAYHIMENLHYIPADLMQEALKNCKSIKVKRLTLCLAKIQNVPWYAALEREKIDLGEGERQHIKEGLWDSEYKIYYPSFWKKGESNVF